MKQYSAAKYFWMTWIGLLLFGQSVFIKTTQCSLYYFFYFVAFIHLFLILGEKTFEYSDGGNPSSTDVDDNAVEITPYPRQYPPTTTNNRRTYDRFNEWMKIIMDFFMNGNWLNGGPDDFLDYITKTLTKLLNVLLNNGESGGSGGRHPFLTSEFFSKAPKSVPGPAPGLDSAEIERPIPANIDPSSNEIEWTNHVVKSNDNMRNSFAERLFSNRNGPKSFSINDLLKMLPVNQFNRN